MADVTPQNNPVLAYAAQSAITQAKTTANANAISNLTDTINNATSDDIAAVGDQGTAAQIIKGAQDSAALQTSSRDAAALARLGADPTAANFRLQDLTTQKNDAYDKANEIAATIAQKQSATLLSDPLGFINAQFTLPADIAQHNYYVNLHNSAAGEYDEITGAVTKEAQMNKAVEATMTAAQAQADQDQIVSMTRQQQDKLKVQAAQYNISGIKDLQSLNENDLSNAAQRVSVAAEQSRLQMQNENAAAMRAQRLLSTQMLQEKLDQKKATDQEMTDAVHNINVAAARLGGTTLTPQIALARLKRGDPVVTQMLHYGEDIAANGGNAEGVPIGATPAQVGAFMTHAQIIPTGTQSSTYSYIAGQTNTLAGAPAVQAEKDPNARLNLINDGIKADVAKQAAGISDNAPNIYAAPPIASLVASVPALANNSFINDVLLPKAQANPNMPSSAADITAAAIAAVKADPSKLNDVAQGVANFYNAAVYSNNKLKGYGETGLPLQTNYPAQIPTGFLGRNATVDLTNPVVVKTMLMKQSIPNTVGSIGGPMVFGINAISTAAARATTKQLGN